MKFDFVANLPVSLPVKEFWKSVNIWGSYEQEFGVLFFLRHSVYAFVSLNLHICRTSSSAIAEGPHDASSQLKSCQLPRNSAETTYTTSPDQIDGMKLEI